MPGRQRATPESLLSDFKSFLVIGSEALNPVHLFKVFGVSTIRIVSKLFTGATASNNLKAFLRRWTFETPDGGGAVYLIVLVPGAGATSHAVVLYDKLDFAGYTIDELGGSAESGLATAGVTNGIRVMDPQMGYRFWSYAELPQTSYWAGVAAESRALSMLFSDRWGVRPKDWIFP